MAYFLKQNENNNQNNQQQQNQNVGGNTYSTSGGEVSNDSSNNINSANSSNNSNTSGNWVNLNSYLDANQNKAGKYVSNLVNPYTSQQAGYESGLNDSKQAYQKAIQKNTLDKNKGADVANRYYNNSNSITNDEWQLAQNTQKGYTGPDVWENTGNDYGYFNLNKQANQFKEVSDNLDNDVYLQSLMNQNLSQGGKTLNSFLVGATDSGKNKIQDYKTSFNKLYDLLDNQKVDLNNQQANQKNIATQNQADYLKALDAAKAAEKTRIQNAYDTQQATAEKNKNAGVGSVAKTMNISKFAANNKPITISIANTPYQAGNASSQLKTELSELEARDKAMRAGIKGSGSQSDINFDFGGYGRGANAQNYVNQQIQRANSVMSDLDQGLRHNKKAPQISLLVDLLSDENANTAEGFTARQLLQQIIQGDIEYNTGIQKIVDMVPGLNTPSAAKQAWDSFRENAETVVTAPAKWARNGVKKVGSWLGL